MPYIIVVNKPGCMPESDPTATETLEEAIEAAEAEIDVHNKALGEEPEANAYFDDARIAALALGEDGGVINLSDGYVIDVCRVNWKELATRVGDSAAKVLLPDDTPAEYLRQRILDAYNEAH